MGKKLLKEKRNDFFFLFSFQMRKNRGLLMRKAMEDDAYKSRVIDTEINF